MGLANHEHQISYNVELLGKVWEFRGIEAISDLVRFMDTNCSSTRGLNREEPTRLGEPPTFMDESPFEAGDEACDPAQPSLQGLQPSSYA